ncbi:MAG: VWA domain-containing protein [Clostridia bacterium]|nr:VWA domain-containing protein [Clostridia bacterium]
MNQYDLGAAMKKVDEDLVKEAAPKKNILKSPVGRGIKVVCLVLALSLIGTAVFFLFRKPSVIDPANTAYNDGIIGERKKDASNFFDAIEGLFPSSAKTSESGRSGWMEADDVAAPSVYGIEGAVSSDQIKAGTLTAGEWRDIANLAEWFKLIRENSWYPYAENRSLFSNKAVKITVKDGENVCFNVKVVLKDNAGTVLASGRTDINGEAYLFYGITKDAASSEPATVTVNEKDFALNGEKEIEVEARNAGLSLSQIDIMYMIDTTGSMGDELRYIQEELKDMTERVAKYDESVSIRVSVNFYRDEGDDYIVKYYDFRTDIEECLAQISQENAEGGGDWPEAVHTALDNAVSGHQWREDALKLCFFVLDAPPHTESELQGVNKSVTDSLTNAQELGIRIIPVSCSGGDQETEYILRSFAAITGGTFIFLTDDSGIGLPHEEVTVGDYDVETLNECMIRVVCEYAGYHYEKPVSQVEPKPVENQQ